MSTSSASLPTSGKFDHLFGVALIFVVASIWTVASFVSQRVVSEVDPFLFTYLGNTLFTFYLPISIISKWISRTWSKRRGHRYELLQSEHDPETLESIKEREREEDWANDSEAWHAALWVAPLWFVGNWLYNISFLGTSATSNAILSQTSALFTYGLSVWMLGEHYSNVKLLYVVITILGVGLVAYKDHEESLKDKSVEGDSTWGDLACIAGSCIYGFYSVVMRKKLGNEHHTDLMLFFGYIGLFTTLAVTPVIVLLYWAGVYTKDDIFISRSDAGLIAGEGLVDNIIADLLLAKAVLLVGPTLVSLGLASTIPMTAICEVFLSLHAISRGRTMDHKGLPTWVRKPQLLVLTLLGTLCVVLGFFGFNQQPGQAQQEREEGVELSEELDMSHVGPDSPRKLVVPSTRMDSPRKPHVH